MAKVEEVESHKDFCVHIGGVRVLLAKGCGIRSSGTYFQGPTKGRSNTNPSFSRPLLLFSLATHIQSVFVARQFSAQCFHRHPHHRKLCSKAQVVKVSNISTEPSCTKLVYSRPLSTILSFTLRIGTSLGRISNLSSLHLTLRLWSRIFPHQPQPSGSLELLHSVVTWQTPTLAGNTRSSAPFHSPMVVVANSAEMRCRTFHPNHLPRLPSLSIQRN